ncbi:MAG: vanadium-dependent haloperoxidase [Acidobacteriota bacterium]|nr:vanadium-dependent haloperoxidase [Acidobacteriota bacterium]
MNNESENKSETKLNLSAETPAKTNRRNFLGNLGKAGMTAAAAVVAAPLLDSKSTVVAQIGRGTSVYHKRAAACFQVRMDAAQANFQRLPPLFSRPTNGDEDLYENKIANYSKGLPHNSNGEVNLTAYNALLDALNTGNPTKFEQIPLGGNRRLTSPQAGLAFDLEGKDSFGMIQIPPPAFASREIAAEIAENYWMALLRDVPFSEYPTNPIADAAAADLNLFGTDFRGAKNSQGQVTPDLLFRGLSASDKTGPAMSQFWYLPCFFGANEINQRIRTVRTIADGGRNFMTDFASWLAVQNGVSPQSGDVFDSTPRYIRNGRDIGQWVHIDVLFQGYFQAFLVIAGTLGVNADSGNPYRNSQTQDGFATFGGPHIATLLCEVSTRALKAVWNQKWFVHRRMRPEVFAARVDRTAFHGANYPIHGEILKSINTNSRLGGYLPAGNSLLPMAFPEGSPMHPAYGAGHATVAGACVTILKAWFDESTVIENPVIPDSTGQILTPYLGETLTIGGELNKIASNVALGRNIAGVHWRSDGTESLKLGEAIAISILKDQKACYNEQFDGFSLTKFDGTTVTV